MRISQLPKPAVFIVGFFLAASLLAPLPYAVLEPGEGQNVLGSVIRISQQKTYPTTGKLLLTTVYVTSPGSALFGIDVLRSWLSASSVVLPRAVLYPPGKSSKEIDSANLVDMADSQQFATAAALRYLGYPVNKESISKKNDFALLHHDTQCADKDVRTKMYGHKRTDSCIIVRHSYSTSHYTHVRALACTRTRTGTC